MKKSFLTLLLSLVLLPSFVFANCSNDGYTVVYVNGIFKEENAARSDSKALGFEYSKRNNKDVDFLLGFNPSHLNGGGDVAKSVLQAYGINGLDTDLISILQQVHSELSTRKVLLVGHSQGTFYTNFAYDYLIGHGVPKESIGVYNIATPADIVAGGGNYLTSSTDKVINKIVRDLAGQSYAKKPLPANISIILSPKEQNSDTGGHSLSEVYLASEPERIIGDINNALNNLSSNGSSNECFEKPKTNLGQKVSKTTLAFGDFSVLALNKIGNTIKNTTIAVTDAVFYFAWNFIYDMAELLKDPYIWIAGLNASQISQTAPKIIDVQRLSPIDVGRLYSDDMVDATEDYVVVATKQDQIDDLLEKIDVLKRQLADLEAREKQDSQEKLAQTQNTDNADIAIQNENPDNVIVVPAYYSGGGRTPYPKLLISEVQIGGTADTKEEFVELYNPNNQDVDLTNWYVQRKTKTGDAFLTYAPNTLFSGRKITANGYFLIARQNYFNFLGDIWVENPITDDNSLALKNPNGEIVDMVGFGLAQDYEFLPALNPIGGQSIGRGIQEKDFDNNLTDFSLNIPSPKTNNIIYVAPLPEDPKDTIAPDVTFKIETNQKNLSFKIDFDITDTAEKVAPTGIAGYSLRWKEEINDWQQDVYRNISDNPVNFSGTRDFSGKDETNYYFQIKTRDLAGNESDWMPEIPVEVRVSLPKKVLINEIQIDSKNGSGGTEDDWIEFYNPNDIDVNLSNWSIQKHGSDDPCSIDKSYYKKNFTDGAKITAKGFFLFASSNANDFLKNMADMTATFSLSDNNTIYLVRSQEKITDENDVNIVDKVGYGVKSCFSETSPAPLPPDAKSIERKKLGQDTDNNSQDFKISDEGSPKETFPRVTIQDAIDYARGPGANVPGAYEYNLLIKWQSPNSNIDFYQVQYKLNDGQWLDWLANTTKTEEYFQGSYSLSNDNIYYLRARAQDKDGILGEWSKEVKIDLLNPVIINEVAYAGTNASPDDQWIELYNRTNNDIDLTGWKIVSGTGQGLNRVETLNIPLRGVILAKGYFVLERGDDDVLKDILANQIFENKINKNYLFLRAPNNRYVDEFYATPTGLDETVFVKDENHYSMERLSPASLGMMYENWRINNNLVLNGKDRLEGQIYGTPGQKNSMDRLYTYYDNSFAENTVLKKEFSPYLFSSQNLQVFKGVTLTIEPGVVIKFNGTQSKLHIDGTLKAIGTLEEPIIFTSFRDDEFGGDSNLDKDASVPGPGDWQGLYFSPDSINSELENVIVRYAGSIFVSSPLKPGNAIWVDQSLISLKNSVVENNKNRVLVLVNSNSVIDNVKFLNNTDSSWPSNQHQSRAIDVRGGAPQIKNSFFKKNYYGIYIGDFENPTTGETILGAPILENNQFEENSVDIFPVPVPPDAPEN